MLLLLIGCDSAGLFSQSPENTQSTPLASPTVALERIDIVASPITTSGVSNLTLAVGNKQPFEVMGLYVDGSSRPLTDVEVRHWRLSEYDVGRFDEPGVLTATQEGVTTITVTKDGITSNALEVNVTAAVITSIQVTPSPVNIAKGLTEPLTATAIFSDATSSDVTDSVTWAPTNTATATVSSTGLLTAVAEGSTTLTVSMTGVPDVTVDVNVSAAVITSIQVMPSPVDIGRGQIVQLTATTIYSDATPPSDVSNSVMWVSDDDTIATVSASGELTAVAEDNTIVTVSMTGVPDVEVDVNVSAPVATSIQVTPSPVNIRADQTEQLIAEATMSYGAPSDVSNSVTWTSDDDTIATVSASGLVTAVAEGNTIVTVSMTGMPNVEVTVTVLCNFAGACIDIFDTGGGKLFTSSPSVAYLDSIGGSTNTDGTRTENGTRGHAGDFYRFSLTNANALCDTYNTLILDGRTNWRLPTIDELKVELFDASGNMFTARGWPTHIAYWSSTVSVSGSNYNYMFLRHGTVSSADPSYQIYVSCVSDP